MPDPLRAMLLTAKLSPNSGGLAVSVPLMAHGIDRFDDVEMHVMGTIDPGYPDAVADWGHRVHAFPVSKPAALQRAPQMRSALKSLSPDLIDVQGLWTWASYVNLQYWRQHRRAYIVTPRGMLDPWARANSQWKKRFFSAFAETEHLREASCLRATAEMEAEHFRALGLRAPIAIIPNAIDVPPLAAKPAHSQRRVLFLSRIHPKKGIDILLRAWQSLQLEYPEWELVVAGMDEGGYESEMKTLSDSLGLNNISFPGAVFGTEKDRLYRSSDLFVLPTHAENFGLVVAEALAQEVPVITTKNAPWAGLEDRDCGWWIDLDEHALATALRKAMECPAERRSAMGQRGRAWMMESFGIKNVASAMRDLYCWVAGRGPRPGTVYD